MSLSGIAQFFLGFFLGITLLAGSAVAAGYYFFTKLAATPPKPVFAEERPKLPVAAKPASSPKASNSQPSSQPAPSKPVVKKELPPGAYTARVTWPEGLILRAEPGLEAERVGGVAFNQQLIILRVSDDKKWQKVRVADGEQEGWVKAGNIERVND